MRPSSSEAADRAAKSIEGFAGTECACASRGIDEFDFVVACVDNDDDLRSVTLSDDGAFDGMRNSAIFIDHTTASSHLTRELDHKAKAPRPCLHRCAGFGKERAGAQTLDSRSCVAAKAVADDQSRCDGFFRRAPVVSWDPFSSTM